jgi:hypothetical protein
MLSGRLFAQPRAAAPIRKEDIAAHTRPKVPFGVGN